MNNPTFLPPVEELLFEYFRSSGPGGQNVNKVSSAVRLRFDIRNSKFLTEEIKPCLEKLAGNRLTVDGFLLIECQRFRTQERNREEALLQLAGLIERASRRPRKRHPTRPTSASRQRRLATKKRRSMIKNLRRISGDE